MRADFSLYTTEYISGVMSLRKPQKKSLEILDEIVNSVNLKKGMNLQAALGAVKALCPTCTDFERDFMSLTFALATGVGKTRLMGAFIAYLYTQHNIKNFFVVAPNTTIGFEGSFDLVDYKRDGTVGTVDISDGVYDIFDFEYGDPGELPDMPVYYIEQNNQGGITMVELR